MAVQKHTKLGTALSELSALMEYPSQRLINESENWLRRYITVFPAAAAYVAVFKDDISKLSLPQLEEVYTRTFDMAPICVPYISAHIYGDENYERAALMTGLAERYNQQDFKFSGEMPDHLKVVLKFLNHCEEEELAEFIEYVLQRPVQEMVESLKDQSNPYFSLLAGIRRLIDSPVNRS